MGVYKELDNLRKMRAERSQAVRKQYDNKPDDEEAVDASSEGSNVEEEEIGSEGSNETDDDIDESVMEEMQKLEESFVGISRKYRLINRIGEGLSCPMQFCRCRDSPT